MHIIESVQELSLEVKRLKKIIFELQEQNREDYLSYEEGLVFDESMEDLKKGNIFSLEYIENERKNLGLKFSNVSRKFLNKCENILEEIIFLEKRVKMSLVGNAIIVGMV